MNENKAGRKTNGAREGETRLEYKTFKKKVCALVRVPYEARSGDETVRLQLRADWIVTGRTLSTELQLGTVELGDLGSVLRRNQ